MKILCIDTSSNLCSVAILEDYNLINKIELDNGLTHSETLMPLISKTLEDSNLKLKDINLIIVDIGPGSFTGIRIGISTAKAFSDSLGIPCIGITSLETLAYSVNTDGIICSSIPCKNNYSYFAIYKKQNNKFETLLFPAYSSNDEIKKLLNSKFSELTDNIQFIGNNIFDENCSTRLNIHSLGIAGLNKFKDNNYIGENILPLYLKKPQAQELLEAKYGKDKK